jgi:hypothetical protein
MNDLRALHDAFGELERRADAAAHGVQPALPQPRRAFSLRLVPVAASVAAVAGLAGAAVWLAPGDGGGTQAAGSGTTSSTTIVVPPAPEWTGIPRDADQLTAQFKVVLGDTATFEVTDTGSAYNGSAPQSADTNAPEQPVNTSTPPPPSGATSVTTKPDGGTSNGAAIVGKFTAAGVTGGFDLQIYAGTAGETDACATYVDMDSCTVTTLPGGRTLMTGVYELVVPGGVTYHAMLTDADGRVILMHISNMGDPKGADGVLAPQPPLTADQLTAIVTSDLW